MRSARDLIVSATAHSRGPLARRRSFRAPTPRLLRGAFPIETVSKFELKTTEAEGWIEQTGLDYMLRNACIISLILPMSFVPQSVVRQLGRVTYTGGYVMPGTTPSAGQTALPADLEWAAVEQIAAWFQQRDKLGLLRYWPSGGTFLAFPQEPLLPQVAAIIR